MATTKATLLAHRSATSFSDLTLSGDLTVNGTTTTLDTTVQNVDKLEIGASSTDYGAKINQASTGHILQLQDGGTDVMVVKDGGNVGIGTNNPSPGLGGSDVTLEIEGATSPSLTINDTGQAEKYSLYADSNDFKIGYGTTILATFQNDGKVGIGEDTSPFSKLNVVDTSWSSGSPYGAVATITGKDTNDLNWGHLMLSDSTTGTINKGGQLRFAVGEDGSNMNPIAGISGLTEHADADYGYLAFYTRPDGTNTTCTERMRIDSAGNVGIGVIPESSPLTLPAPLYTSSDTGGMIRWQNQDTDHGSDVCIQGYHVDGHGCEIYIGLNSYINTGGGIAKFNLSEEMCGMLLGRTGDYGFYSASASGSASARFQIDSIGRIYLGAYADASNTSYSTNAGANLYIGTGGDGGVIYRSTSSRRFKTNIVDTAKGLNELLTLRPVDFNSLCENDNKDKLRTGFIAEEVDNAGFDEYIQRGTDGETNGLNYAHMVALCVKSIQELSAKVTTLENATN